jgi:hypothetical protein
MRRSLQEVARQASQSKGLCSSLCILAQIRRNRRHPAVLLKGSEAKNASVGDRVALSVPVSDETGGKLSRSVACLNRTRLKGNL